MLDINFIRENQDLVEHSIREKGYKIVYNPYIELMHYESKTRGYEDSPEKHLEKRFLTPVKGMVNPPSSLWT